MEKTFVEKFSIGGTTSFWGDPKTQHFTCTAEDHRRSHRWTGTPWRTPPSGGSKIFICHSTCTAEDLRNIRGTSAEEHRGRPHVARHGVTRVAPNQSKCYHAGGQPTWGPTCGHHMWPATCGPHVATNPENVFSTSPRKMCGRCAEDPRGSHISLYIIYTYVCIYSPNNACA